MPTIRKTQAVGAGGSVANLLTGERYEFARGPQLLRFFAVQDGATDGAVKISTFAGNVVDLDRIDVPLASAAGLGPNTQDHFLGKMVVQGGDRIQVKLENTDAVNASNVRVMVEINT